MFAFQVGRVLVSTHMKRILGDFPSAPHPWRPPRPRPKYHMLSLGSHGIDVVCGIVGTIEYEAGDHRFRALQIVGVLLILVALMIYLGQLLAALKHRHHGKNSR
jgi:hypothetical protein